MRYVFLLFALLLVACGSTPQAQIGPQDVLEAFQEAGLEAEVGGEMTPQDYGVAPVGEEGIRFLIPSLGEESGGRIIRYESAQAAAAAKEVYDSLGEQSGLLFTWAFQNGALVVQINGDLPEAQAREYEDVLNQLE